MVTTTFRRSIVLAIAVAGAACASPPKASAPVTVDKEVFDSSLHVDLAASTRLPSGVYYRDLTAGQGAPVVAGQELDVLYTVWLADGTRIESVVAGQDPYRFVLGAHSVIEGWDVGLAGMRVGGVRQLVVPSELAYGPPGSGKIPPNANLVFSVELVSAR
jgi:FKBP-type peptidyl-prolyl cis-trans isomerase FkpA